MRPKLAAAEHADGGTGRDDAVAVTSGSSERTARDVGRDRRRGTPAASRAAPDATWRESRRRAARRSRRPAATDRDGRHRHAFRHLHDREQRIEAVERRALHGHADDRQHRVRRHHARQVRRASGAGNDDFEAAVAPRSTHIRPSAPVCDGPKRCGIRAARRTRSALVGLPHRLPVRLAAHDDADERTRLWHAPYFIT